MLLERLLGRLEGEDNFRGQSPEGVSAIDSRVLGLLFFVLSPKITLLVPPRQNPHKIKSTTYTNRSTNNHPRDEALLLLTQ
jgi:hypothetical protein